jgi:uncharacterized surface protein with fasciclin (FAS1) repeats
MDIQYFSYRTPHRWVVLAATMTIFMGACFIGACKKTSGSGADEQTLKAFLSHSPRYTLFNRALQRTHLDSLLGGTNPYTVFAVGDSAMSAAGFSAAGIDSADIGILTGILRYHFVPGSFASTDVQLYQETILTTSDSSFQAYLEYNNFGLFYNGIPIVSVDNRLINGLVQGIQSLARPPIGDVLTTITRTPVLRDFGYIVTEAVNNGNAGASFNPIVPYISGTPSSPLTLFLPDNNYFASLGIDNYAAILQQGRSASAFMSQGQYFTSDFIGKNKIIGGPGSGWTNNQFWFSDNGSDFVTVDNSTVNVIIHAHYRIVEPNIVATNGIIHVIESY